MFDDLIKEVFGFSFSPWFARNLWDDSYESYSAIENGRMLANICIYKTKMIVCGKPFYALQFGGVATRKDERDKGLSRLLLEYILAKHPDIPAFLGANPGVTDFYPRFGFRPVQTYRPYIEATVNNKHYNAIKLSPDDVLLNKAIRNLKMHSNALDSLNTQSIQMFHLILDYPDAIYHLPDSGVIVVAEQKDDALLIADIIAETPISFEALQKELPFQGVKSIEFGFNPDWLGVSPEWKAISMEKEPYFIRGEWSLPENFRFPMMSET